MRILQDIGIGEEEEITVCELFDQYERRGLQQGLQQGIQAVIATCKKLNASFEVTAAQIKEQFKLEEAEVQDNMRLYW